MSAAYADGIALGGTRLIFDGAKEAASLSVTNSSKTDVWLMRFWISPYDETAPEHASAGGVVGNKNNSVPFVVTPPLHRLDPQTDVQLRVNRVSNTLPTDRESVYYLNALAIPPKKGEKGYEKAVTSGVQFAVNTRIKLFYRPAGLNDSAIVKALPGKVTVSANGKTLTVKNPTPYHITLTTLSVNGKTLEVTKDTMLAPFGSFTLLVAVPHGKFSYQTVDDNGARTSTMEKTF